MNNGWSAFWKVLRTACRRRKPAHGVVNHQCAEQQSAMEKRLTELENSAW